MPSSIPPDHWSRNLKTDTVAHILSFLDEDAMVRWEEAEGGFFCRGDGDCSLWGEKLYVEAMNTAMSRQWKNLYDMDRNRRRPRWAHQATAVTFETDGKEYVKECRRGQSLAAEAQNFYDFQAKPERLLLASENGDLGPDILGRTIPLKQSTGDSAPPGLSWNRWTIPDEDQNVVFVTITKVDTQDFLQGYRTFEHVHRTFDPFRSQPPYFLVALSLGLVHDVGEELRWPKLQELLQDWGNVTAKADALKAIMENMQVTITTCGVGGGVVISTGGFEMFAATSRFLGGREIRVLFHGRHPESPNTDRVEGFGNCFDVAMFVEESDVKLSIRRCCR